MVASTVVGNDTEGMDRNDAEGRSRTMQSMVCSMCMAVGMATTLRLPREVANNGGLPFMVAYTVLALGMAFPIVFLDMALGKFTEQGAIRLWRAVPILKGLGYVKLFLGFLVAVYYMISLGIACAMLIWTAKGPVPLVECRELHRATDGYRIFGISGQKCLHETFLKPVIEDPMWYAIIASIVFTLWLLISLCLIKIPQTFIISIYVCGSSILLLSLLLASLENFGLAGKMLLDVRWDSLRSLDLWNSACIQLLFSTNLGFGYHVTMGGTIYKNVNIFKSAFWYIIWNILGSWLSIVLWYCMANSNLPKSPSILMILMVIYDSSLMGDYDTLKSSLAFSIIIFSGLISMVSMTYPLVWCISLEDCYHKRSVGWLISVTGIFCSLSVFILGLDAITILDVHIVPVNLIVLLCLKFYGLFFLYGLKSILQDLGFLLHRSVNFFVVLLWTLIPVYFCVVLICRAYDYFKDWPESYWNFWFTVGSLLSAMVIVVAWGVKVITHKDGYGFWQKLVSATKPSRKWGPEEFKLRYNWLQYRSTQKKIWQYSGNQLCEKLQMSGAKSEQACPETETDKNSTNASTQQILWINEPSYYQDLERMKQGTIKIRNASHLSQMCPREDEV